MSYQNNTFLAHILRCDEEIMWKSLCLSLACRTLQNGLVCTRKFIDVDIIETGKDRKDTKSCRYTRHYLV